MYCMWHLEFAFADIDECSDLTLNECPDDTDCQNLHGNYTCNCKSGFQKNDSKCEGMQLVNIHNLYICKYAPLYKPIGKRKRFFFCHYQRIKLFWDLLIL